MAERPQGELGSEDDTTWLKDLNVPSPAYEDASKGTASVELQDTVEIGKDDAGIDARGSKAEHGIEKESESVPDMARSDSLDVSVEHTDTDEPGEKVVEDNPLDAAERVDIVNPVLSEGADIVNPVLSEGADRDGDDEGDPAAVVWPQFDEGPEITDDDNDDADWEESPAMEADVEDTDDEDDDLQM